MPGPAMHPQTTSATSHSTVDSGKDLFILSDEQILDIGRDADASSEAVKWPTLFRRDVKPQQTVKSRKQRIATYRQRQAPSRRHQSLSRAELSRRVGLESSGMDW